MNKKFVKCFGSSRPQDQKISIEKGFLELGWDFPSMEFPFTDLVISNDPGGYDDAINYQKTFGGKLIFNILDLAPHLVEIGKFDLIGIKQKLLKADVITCISKVVQDDIKNLLGLNATIIYNPAKQIIEIPKTEETSETKPLKFLYVGRANDELVKRFSLVKNFISKFYSENQLLVVGSEDPNFGKYSGVVADKYLSAIYGHSDFVLLPSKTEGIGLSSVESISAGRCPILCNDNRAAMEFLPEFTCDPNIDSMQEKILDYLARPEYYNELIKKYQQKYYFQFSYQVVTDNLIKVYENLLKND